MHVRRMSRPGILYDVNESGTARLIYRREEGLLVGMLETITGGTFSVRGKLSEGSPERCTSCDPHIMDFLIVDGEEGSSFKLGDVHVFDTEHHIRIEHPAISFSSDRRLIGAKADVVIHQYLTPSMAEVLLQNEVFIGTMKLHLTTSQRPKESVRRESICSSSDVILEQSDDFLA